MDPLKNIKNIFGTEDTVRVPTTEEMDKVFTDQDRKDQYTVYVQCIDCASWTLVVGNHEMHVTLGGYTKNAVCERCGGRRLDGNSITSKRSFNPVAAKRRKPRGYKKKI